MARRWCTSKRGLHGITTGDQQLRVDLPLYDMHQRVTS